MDDQQLVSENAAYVLLVNVKQIHVGHVGHLVLATEVDENQICVVAGLVTSSDLDQTGMDLLPVVEIV